jgi:SAM-dependent methyltransferase
MSDSDKDKNPVPQGIEICFDLDAGTQEFYSDTTYYDYEFRSRTADIEFYQQHYLDCEGWALEIGVGTGRIAIPAIRSGAQIIGLDPHAGMLQAATKHREQLTKAQRTRLRFLNADVRDFDAGQQFNLITCPFNVLQHMYDHEDIEQALQNIHKHLAPGGLLIFDILMPNFEYLGRSPLERFPGVYFEHPSWNATYQYSEQSAYDPVQQLNQIWLHYTRKDPLPGVKSEAPEYHCIQLSHRYFYPQEMNYLLQKNHFEILACHGNFSGAMLAEHSESMVYFCTAQE